MEVSVNAYQYLEIILTILAVLILPGIGLMIRSAVRSARLESDVRNVIDDVKQVIMTETEAHKEIYEQMREDRKASNQRLMWLEQNLWKRGNG